MKPLVSPNYQPTDGDERGLWQLFDKLEMELSSSSLVVKDDALNSYLLEVVGGLLGASAKDVRLYVVRDCEFNASMAPNGMMIVHTGLLARMRSEAQLAAVLGHEAGHYLRRHSVQNWRGIKTKTAVMAFVGFGGAVATGATGNRWYDLANAINHTLLLSIFSFGRTLEREADAYGLKLLGEARYSPEAAAQVWAQLIDELKASASARNKTYRDRSQSVYSTHPPTEDRMSDLAASAKEMEQNSPDGRSDRKEEWLAAVAGIRPQLIEEQVKLNDPGASLYLINNLAKDGWDGTLHYYKGEAYRLRGEEGDSARAVKAYADAIAFENAPAAAYKAHGYALLKSGKTEEGKRALARYLELLPSAPDAAMVRYALQQ